MDCVLVRCETIHSDEPDLQTSPGNTVVVDVVLRPASRNEFEINELLYSSLDSIISRF